MAAQSPSGIRLSAVSSREGRSGPGPRRAGGRAREEGGRGRRRLEAPARRPGGGGRGAGGSRRGRRGAAEEPPPPPCRCARRRSGRPGGDRCAPGGSGRAAVPARGGRLPLLRGRRQLSPQPRPPPAGTRPAPRAARRRRAARLRRGAAARCRRCPVPRGPGPEEAPGPPTSRPLPACQGCLAASAPVLTNARGALGRGRGTKRLQTLGPKTWWAWPPHLMIPAKFLRLPAPEEALGRGKYFLGRGGGGGGGGRLEGGCWAWGVGGLRCGTPANPALGPLKQAGSRTVSGVRGSPASDKHGKVLRVVNISLLGGKDFREHLPRFLAGPGRMRLLHVHSFIRRCPSRGV